MAIENFEGHQFKRFNKALELSAKQEAAIIEEVDGYLAGQVKEGMTYEDVKLKYIKKYIDFLESSAVQPLKKGERHKPLTPDQKLALIKRQIYLNEIFLPQKSKNIESTQKAA